VSRGAAADDYPARPVRLFVTVPAGGSPDIIGRLIAQAASEKLGQPFVVENKPGASTNIGTELALKSAPDGNTLLLAMSSNAINPALYHHLNFDFLRDAVPVASIATIPLVMDVNPAVPAKTVPEFIAYAKANPGKINLARAAAARRFMSRRTVPHDGRSQPGRRDLSGRSRGDARSARRPGAGDVRRHCRRRSATSNPASCARSRYEPKRQELLPDVPAMRNFCPAMRRTAGTASSRQRHAADVVATLNKKVNAALADPAMRKRFTDLGCEVFTGTPADFGKFIAAETDKWAKVIKFANVKAD